MSLQTFIPYRKKRLMAALIGCAVGITVLLISYHRSAQLKEARQNAFEIGTLQAHSFEYHLNRALSAAIALGSYLQYADSIEDFDRLAQGLMTRYRGISALQLAPDGIISKTYPLKGNEAALGQDLLHDPGRSTNVRQAIQSRKFTLADPHALIQGGLGLMGIYPVFIHEEGTKAEKFWGLAIVLIKSEDLLADSNFSHLKDAGFDYKLTRTDPVRGKSTQIVSSISGKFELPLKIPVKGPYAAWSLSLAPMTGWYGPLAYDTHVYLAVVLCLLICVLSVYIQKFMEKLTTANKVLRQEISAREKISNKLAASESRYHELISNIGSGVAVYRVNGDGDDFIFTDFNKAAEEMEDIRREDVIDKSVYSIFPGIRNFGLDKVFRQVWQTGEPASHPITIYQDDRIIGWRQNYVYKLPTGEIVAVYTDETERRKAEQDLRESEERYRSVVDNINIGILLLSTDLKILAANHWFNKRFEPSEGDAPAKCYEMLNYATGRYCEDCPAQQTLTDGKVHEAEIKQQTSTDRRYYKVISSPVLDEKGKVKAVIVMHEDITKAKRLQQEADHRLQQVVQADKLSSLGELVAGVAHEINNPTSFITYNIPVLKKIWTIAKPAMKEYGQSHPEIFSGNFDVDDICLNMEEIIDAIEAGSERITAIVANLKDFARLDDSSGTRKVNVNEAVKKALTITGAQIRKTGVNIDVGLVEDPPFILGHLQKVEQIVINLLINACFAVSKAEKKRIQLKTRCLETRKTVLIEVEDTGIGMERKILEKIFEPFFSTRRESGGTGLGLSVSYGLLQEHNGAVCVLSRPGRGTRFSLLLPLDRRDASFKLEPLCLVVSYKSAGYACVDITGQMVEPATTCEKEEIEAMAMACIEQHPEIDTLLVTGVTTENEIVSFTDNIIAAHPLLNIISLFENSAGGDNANNTALEPELLVAVQKAGDLKPDNRIMIWRS